MRARALLPFVLVAACGSGAGTDAASVEAASGATFRAPLPGLLDLDGRPFPGPNADGGPSVFVLVRTDCPISNRYAPEVERLHQQFAPRGVAFWRVYPDPEEDPAAIREHGAAYAYGMPALRDTAQELVRLGGVRVTPEALVFDGDGALVYAGRIDDRVTDFGKARVEPRVRDLFEVLQSLTDRRPVAFRRTEAVGCPVPSL